MLIIETIKEMKKVVKEAKFHHKTIGFVPTMGSLHEGHLSLIRRAKEENDLVVVSIFVNPTQFGVGEDYESYPRDLLKDAQLSEGAGADILFHPSVAEMYPSGYKTFVDVRDITDRLCGSSRVGHFIGVTTVVSKLFHIVEPARAYFGQKDAQQIVVIQRMVQDLNMDLEIIPCPIIREADGLALSSRNSYLNDKERKAGLILNKSLMEAKKMIMDREKNGMKIKNFISKNIEKEPLAKIDYVEIVEGTTLEPVEELSGNILIAIAVKIGTTRLIDNLRLEV